MHNKDKNGSNRPPLLCQFFCQNHFEHQNRSKIHNIEAIFNLLNLRLSHKSRQKSEKNHRFCHSFKLEWKWHIIVQAYRIKVFFQKSCNLTRPRNPHFYHSFPTVKCHFARVQHLICNRWRCILLFQYHLSW